MKTPLFVLAAAFIVTATAHAVPCVKIIYYDPVAAHDWTNQDLVVEEAEWPALISLVSEPLSEMLAVKVPVPGTSGTVVFTGWESYSLLYIPPNGVETRAALVIYRGGKSPDIIKKAIIYDDGQQILSLLLDSTMVDSFIGSGEVVLASFDWKDSYYDDAQLRANDLDVGPCSP